VQTTLGAGIGRWRVRGNWPDDHDTAPASADVPRPHEAAETGTEGADTQGRPPAPGDATTRTERSLEHRATVEAANRTYSIDQVYERVTEIERGTVTPAMRRLEAEDPSRHLAGLENCLKGKERLAEKVKFDIRKKGRDVDQAVANVKDVIRYTFVYEEERYTASVYSDCERLENAGFGRFDRRNTWEHEEYKGINSRWRIPGTSQLFEVQFHTQASLSAKEETHPAYERIRSLPEDDEKVARLHAYQRAVTAKVPIPPGAVDIPDYRL
jgi:hypothetical protein